LLAGVNLGILMLHDERQQLSDDETWNSISKQNQHNDNFWKEETKQKERLHNAIHYGHSTPLRAREKLQ
jgi:hypothetical protein